MPRIKQYADRYATADFLTELRVRMASLGLRYDQDLARAAGIPASTIALKLKEPEKLTVSQLRKIVAAVDPDPVEVLRFLGYSGKAIKKFTEENHEN